MKIKEYVLFAFICLLFCLNGCSVLGLVIGINAGSDEELFNSNTQSLSIIDSTETIKIITFNNDTLRGEYLGLSILPYNEYANEYKIKYEELKDTPMKIPQIGENVDIGKIVTVYKNNQSYKDLIMVKGKTFFGFVLGGVLISDSNYESFRVLSTESLSSMHTFSGEEVNISKLKSLIMQGELPYATILKLNIDNSEKTFFTNNIKEIIIEKSDNYWLLGLACGAAVDALIISSLSFEMHEAGNRISNSWFSSGF